MAKKPLSKAKARAKANKPERLPGALPRKLDYTASFHKSWARYDKAGMRDLSAIQTVSGYLVARQLIPAEYLDHPLTGDWIDHREMHLQGDLLLIYKVYGQENLVVLIELGTHSELFN